MSNIRSLAEVGVRLEEAVQASPCHATIAAVLVDRDEEIDMVVLDSEHGNHRPGVLHEYLETWLHLKRLELDMAAFPDQREA